MPGLDATYRAFLPSLPEDLRRSAAGLPHRLELTRDPEGGWDGLLLLDLNREPTAYAAESPGSPGRSLLSDETLDRYRDAHHWSAIYWLTADAVADRKAADHARIARLRRVFLRSWAASLTRATGDRALAREAIGEALRSLRESVAEERARLGRGTLTPASYAALVRGKSRWAGTSARCLLARAGAPERATAFTDAYEAFLFALQCRDDAEDHAEDAALHGASAPGALGIHPASLALAAPIVVAAAIPRARAAGFQRLATFLARWHSAIDSATPAGLPASLLQDAASVAAGWEAQAVSPPARAR